MTNLALTKDDSATIGFVVACLFAGAIDVRELRSWAEHVLTASDACPTYVIDLSTFDQPLFHIYRLIGFVPSSALTDSERVALVGIAAARGRDPFEPVPTKEQALAALAAQRHLLTRFRATFPFIHFEYDHVA
jgi:hypothetical protein